MSILLSMHCFSAWTQQYFHLESTSDLVGQCKSLHSLFQKSPSLLSVWQVIYATLLLLVSSIRDPQWYVMDLTSTVSLKGSDDGHQSRNPTTSPLNHRGEETVLVFYPLSGKEPNNNCKEGTTTTHMQKKIYIFASFKRSPAESRSKENVKCSVFASDSVDAEKGTKGCLIAPQHDALDRGPSKMLASENPVHLTSL